MKNRKDSNVYPPGLNAKKVKDIIAYYDARQGDDLASDADHEMIDVPTTWLEVPVDLVPQVKKLIGRYKKSA